MNLSQNYLQLVVSIQTFAHICCRLRFPPPMVKFHYYFLSSYLEVFSCFFVFILNPFLSWQQASEIIFTDDLAWLVFFVITILQWSMLLGISFILGATVSFLVFLCCERSEHESQVPAMKERSSSPVTNLFYQNMF